MTGFPQRACFGSLGRFHRSAVCRDALFIPLLALVFAGCGGGEIELDVVPVSGKVTVNGEPISQATVTFISSAGHMGVAPLAEDGTFELTSQYGDGVPAGSYRVTVNPPDPGEDEVNPDGSVKPVTVQPQGNIPESYWSDTTTPIEVAVSEETHSFEFDLKK